MLEIFPPSKIYFLQMWHMWIYFDGFKYMEGKYIFLNVFKNYIYIFYIKYIQNNWQNWYIYINIFWSLFWNIFKSIFCNHGVTSKRLSMLLLFDYIIKFNNQSSVYLEQNSYVKASNIKHEYIYSKVAKHDFYYKKETFYQLNQLTQMNRFTWERNDARNGKQIHFVFGYFTRPRKKTELRKQINYLHTAGNYSWLVAASLITCPWTL